MDFHPAVNVDPAPITAAVGTLVAGDDVPPELDAVTDTVSVFPMSPATGT